MYRLFEPDFKPIVEKVSYLTTLDYVRRSYQTELERISRYFDQRVYTVPSDHILNQIITHLDPGTDIQLNGMLNALTARAPYIAKSFGLGSEIQIARPLPSHQFLQNNEYLIAVEPDISAIFRAQTSKDLQPVRALWTNAIDYSLAPPIGINHTGSTHYAMYSVDIVMLVVKYRMYQRERAIRAQQNELAMMNLGSAHFLASQVLPEMIRDIVNLSVVNECIDTYQGRPIKKVSHVKLPISIYDNSERISRCIEYYLRTFKDQQLTYETYLWNLPTVTTENGWVGYRMPSLMKTSQVFWLMMLSRLRLIEFLVQLGGVQGRTYNQGLMNQLHLQSLRLLRENVYTRVLPKAEAVWVEEQLAKFIELSKR